jgi:hypothetical protein
LTAVEKRFGAMSSNKDCEPREGEGEEVADEVDVGVVPRAASSNEGGGNNNENDASGELSILPEETPSSQEQKTAVLPTCSRDAIHDKVIFEQASEVIDQHCCTKDGADHELDYYEIDLESADGREDLEVDRSPANEKAVSGAYQEERRGGRITAIVPGVEYVHTRAPGMRPGSYMQLVHIEARRRAQEQSRRVTLESTIPTTPITAPCNPVCIKESAPSTPSKCTSRQKGLLAYCAAIVACIIVGTAVGVGVALSSQRKGSETESTTRFSPYTSDCNALQAQAQPNVMSQCRCGGKISTVASDITARYTALADTFIPAVFPDFHDSLGTCSPRNQALVWLASGDGISAEPDMRQRYLLALLFITWTGQDWTANTGWLSANTECSWIGITCDGTNQVVKIRLPGTNLSGNLSSDFTLISSLTSLVLDQNGLQGSLPTELVNLSNLGQFSVCDNALAGSIPQEYGRMTQLTYLALNNNHIKGSLPTDLGLLSDLQELRLSNNDLKGTIPTELGLLLSLQSIAFDNNTLTGEIPTEIGLWKNAQTIDFSFNNFHSSTIPTEIGRISTLRNLVLTNTGINGTLPNELLEIQGLQELSFTANNLNGTISPLIGRLTSLGKPTCAKFACLLIPNRHALVDRKSVS